MISLAAIVKVFSVFGIVLVLNRLKLSLSIALLVGSAALGLWMHMGPVSLAQSVAHSLMDIQTVGLALIVGIILVMSRLMKQTGHLDRIVTSFTALSRDPRITGAVMPALIGLLPMPGGALFSAPMVDTALCDNRMTGEEKTAVNYWFRHIWEYWWPLYPGVVLAVALLKVEAWRFMAIMLPMTLVSVLAGTLFILRPMGALQSHSSATQGGKGTIRQFIREIMPIIVLVAAILVQGATVSILRILGSNVAIPGSISILPALAICTLWVCLQNRIPFRQILHAVTDKSIPPMLLLVLAIMVFKGVMGDSHAIVQIRDELMAHHIPILVVVMLMPFISGMITGIAIGFVGTSFPLIVPMFPTTDLLTYLSWAALAYSFGYMGMMLSPVHLCFLVTKDYFNATLSRSYRYLIFPALAVMATASFLFVASRFIV